MATSMIRKTDLVERGAGNANAVGGQTIRIPLTREGLLSEHHINIIATQAYTGVPTSCDPRRFIDTIELQTTDGKRFACDGFMAYDLHRITEKVAAPLVTLGATSTAQFSFELHHEMDGALHDLLTAIRGGDMGQLDLVIKFAGDAANGFIGGTVPLVASYVVEVSEHNYPAMVGILNAMGKPVYGVIKQFVEQQSIAGTTKGRQADVRLAGENSTRFVLIHAHDVTNGTESDAVMESVSIVLKGGEKKVVSWRKLREAAAKRGVDTPGFGLLDWNDDEAGFLDLSNVNDPRLQYTIATTAPASHRVTFGQVFVKP